MPTPNTGWVICIIGAKALHGIRPKQKKWWRLAVAGFRPKAEAGDADAQYKLGDMYESGYGVVLDYVEAEKWYSLAAEAGDTHAQEKLEENYGASRNATRG